MLLIIGNTIIRTAELIKRKITLSLWYGNEKIDFDLSQTALACAHHILQLRMNC